MHTIEVVPWQDVVAGEVFNGGFSRVRGMRGGRKGGTRACSVSISISIKLGSDG